MFIYVFGAGGVLPGDASYKDFARQLLGNPNPSAAIHAWPMQHAVAATLLWSIGLLIIFAPWPPSSTGAAPPANPEHSLPNPA